MKVPVVILIYWLKYWVRIVGLASHHPKASVFLRIGNETQKTTFLKSRNLKLNDPSCSVAVRQMSYPTHTEDGTADKDPQQQSDIPLRGFSFTFIVIASYSVYLIMSEPNGLSFTSYESIPLSNILIFGMEDIFLLIQPVALHEMKNSCVNCEFFNNMKTTLPSQKWRVSALEVGDVMWWLLAARSDVIIGLLLAQSQVAAANPHPMSASKDCPPPEERLSFHLSTHDENA